MSETCSDQPLAGMPSVSRTEASSELVVLSPLFLIGAGPRSWKISSPCDSLRSGTLELGDLSILLLGCKAALWSLRWFEGNSARNHGFGHLPAKITQSLGVLRNFQWNEFGNSMVSHRFPRYAQVFPQKIPWWPLSFPLEPPCDPAVLRWRPGGRSHLG